MPEHDIKQAFYKAGISILSMSVDSIVSFIKGDLSKLRKKSPDLHDFLCRHLTTIDKENVQDKITVLTALLKYKHLTEEVELLLANNEDREVQKLMFSRKPLYSGTESVLVDKLLNGRVCTIYAASGTLHAAQSFPPFISLENQIKVMGKMRDVQDYLSRDSNTKAEMLRVIAERIEKGNIEAVIGPSNPSYDILGRIIRHPNLPPDLQLHFAKNYGEWVQNSLAGKIYKEPSNEAIDLIIQRYDLTPRFRDRFHSRISEYAEAANDLLGSVKGVSFRVPTP
jgi:hypothetical protein